MKAILALLLLSLTSAAALAQTPPPPVAPSSPTEQALSQKLIEEINSNIMLRAALIKTQERLKLLEGAAGAKSAPPAEDKAP